MSAPSDIFLSYSRDDQATARRFAEALKAAGFSVWWDVTLRSGEDYDEVTGNALKAAKAVVVLWSAKSVASRWVRTEATIALQRKTLMPVMVEPCERPIMFELSHTTDFSHWTGDPKDPVWQSYVADVRRLVEQGEPQQVRVTGTPAPDHAGRHSLTNRLTACAVVALLLAGGGIWWMRSHGSHMGVAPVAATSTAVTTSVPDAGKLDIPAASIAVVPFANLTGEPGKEYFSDGMAEELINALAKVKGLQVASRTSSFAYKGKNSDIRRIARDLGVATILEGSVQSAGDRVRIAVQLINAQSGFNLWSETYDRKYGDLFKLQDDLAGEIVTAFKMTMGASLPDFQPQAQPTQDLQAYTLYLQAGAAENRGTDAGARDAVRLAEQAVARDPKFVRAWLVLASARGLTAAPIADVERAARRALELDPGGPAAAQIAQLAARRGNAVEAEDFYSKVDPNSKDPGIRTPHGTSLWRVGHLHQALHEFQEAYRLAPAVAFYSNNLSRISSNLGLDGEALNFAKLAIAAGFDPSGRRTKQIYADAALRAGHYDQAADLMISVLPTYLTDKGGAEAIKQVFAAMHEPAKRAAAISALRQLMSKVKPEDWVVGVFSMSWYAQLGALDDAYVIGDQLREQFGPEHAPTGAWSWLWSPEMRPFRQDPRFQAFATRLGMMPYWEKYGPPDECNLKDGKLTCH